MVFLRPDVSRLNRDPHGFDGGVEILNAVADRATDTNKRDDAGHAPGIELALANAEVLAGFLVGEERTATIHWAILRIHTPRRPVSTRDPRQTEVFHGILRKRIFVAQRTGIFASLSSKQRYFMVF